MRSHLSRALRGVLTTAAVAGVFAAATTVPAEAASGYGRCQWGELCVFSAPLGQGQMLIVKKGMLTLGSWDNRIRSFTNHTDWGVCFNSLPNLDPRGEATHWYAGSQSFDESWMPQLDGAVSSLDVGPDADYFCAGESRYATYSWEDGPKARPAGLPASAAFGDVNSDGFADLLSRNKYGQLWSSHTYDSGGRDRLAGAGWNAMNKLTRHGDQNGDGKEDLFARDTSGVLWFYPGRGDGSFGVRARVGGGWNTMRDLVAAGDLTGDGKGDLLASDGAGTLWTYPGNGKGAFGARKKVGGGWKAMNELVGSGDMNSDQRADLVARDTAGRLWFYPGNGKGAFGARKLIGTGGWNTLTELAGLGDVTGDGRPDLIAHAPSQTGLQVYPGTGAANGGLKSAKTFAGVAKATFVF
ncbi:FG-GAP-like repeat-containing protein [Streptomyces sp. NBC_01220]|uniref:FG-GAP-like repeat-containing protein n=1 Tax=unclassified Streptomyces TaxID=2593676 RepID=UPI0034177D00|nr:FG-GAP-like repeat-containing protein [Streptomyces sp. NBC_01220]